MATKSSNITKKEFNDFKLIVFNFIDQYEKDMRGDLKTTNGDIGIVGTIRELKTKFTMYPSLTYLLATKPVQTMLSLVTFWVMLAILYDFGLLKIIGKLFKIELP